MFQPSCHLIRTLRRDCSRRMPLDPAPHKSSCKLTQRQLPDRLWRLLIANLSLIRPDVETEFFDHLCLQREMVRCMSQATR